MKTKSLHPPSTSHSIKRYLLVTLALLALANPALHAAVPNLLNYQGRIVVGTTNFNGNGQFKFALVNATGSTTYWSNDGTSLAGGQPTNAVTLAVTNGLYSVLLGDTSVPGMTQLIAASVWSNADVRLRIWFSDGTNGSQQLSPDQRLSPNGYLPSPLVVAGAIRARGGAPGAFGNNNNGYAFTGNGGDDDSGLFSSSDGQLELYTNATERLRLDPDGNVGLGTTTPHVALEIARYTAAGPTLRLSGPGGFGAKVGIDLAPYDPENIGGVTTPSARIEASDDNYSAGISFMTKTPGSFNNPLVPRLVIRNDGVTSTLGGLIIESRTSDPPQETGRIWIRTDL